MKAVHAALVAIAVSTLVLAATPAKPQAPAADAGVAALAAIYERVADTLVAANRSETAVIQAILAVERDLALAALARAQAAAPAGVAADLREAAARMGDFATEGGAATQGIRARLLEAGHHHNADDTGLEATYDTGYVVVTKKQKLEALELAKRCARLAETGRAQTSEVAAIRDAFTALAARVAPAK